MKETNFEEKIEKLEEEVKYAIYLEKANNRNKVIQETIDSLATGQSVLGSLFT